MKQPPLPAYHELLPPTVHGISQKAPRAAGMSDWYLQRQLKNFQDGLRGAHPRDSNGLQMSLMADTLHDDQAIDDVIAYINTL